MKNIKLSIKRKNASDAKVFSYFLNVLADKILDVEGFSSIFLSQALYFSYSVGLEASSEVINIDAQDTLIGEMFDISTGLSQNKSMYIYLNIVKSLLKKCLEDEKIDKNIILINVNVEIGEFFITEKRYHQNELDTIEEMLHNAA